MTHAPLAMQHHFQQSTHILLTCNCLQHFTIFAHLVGYGVSVSGNLLPFDDGGSISFALSSGVGYFFSFNVGVAG